MSLYILLCFFHLLNNYHKSIHLYCNTAKKVGDDKRLILILKTGSDSFIPSEAAARHR
jgi:hypothetical protein